MNNREIPLTLLPDHRFPDYIDLATLGMLMIHYNMFNITNQLVQRGIEDKIIKVENGKADYIEPSKG